MQILKKKESGSKLLDSGINFSKAGLMLFVIIFAAFGAYSLLLSRAASVPGDINQDGTVNDADMALLQASFNKNTHLCVNDTRYTCDLNNDNKVDTADLTIIQTTLTKNTATVKTATASSGTLVKTNCSPAGAATDGTMVWNSTNTAGIFDAYVGDGNCVGKALLPAYDGHRGAQDITKDGRYVLLVTAVGWDKNVSWSAPGAGSGNAIQLYDRQTNKLSTLLPSGTLDQRGVIWPRFNADGTKITWAQMLKSTFEAWPIGSWNLHVADVNLAAGTISNNRTWQEPGVPTALYEPYGWIPGTNKVVYVSTAGQPVSDWTAAFQLFTLPDTLDAATKGTRISPKIAPYWSWEKASNAYHEFVNFAPNDPNTLYTSIGAGALGADLWKYDVRTADSSGLLGQPTRVSYFGGNFRAPFGQQAVAGYPAPSYSIIGGTAWVNGAWVAGLCHKDDCANIDAVRITP